MDWESHPGRVGRSPRGHGAIDPSYGRCVITEAIHDDAGHVMLPPNHFLFDIITFTPFHGTSILRQLPLGLRPFGEKDPFKYRESSTRHT